MTVTIVPYAPALRRGVIRLLRDAANMSAALAERYFDWKYCSNPYGSRRRLRLGLSGGRVVAMSGAYALLWRCGGQASVLGISPADLVVAPGCDRGQVVRLLQADALKGHSGLAAMLGFAREPRAPAELESLGWKVVGAWQGRRARLQPRPDRAPHGGDHRATVFAGLDGHLKVPLLRDITVSRRARPRTMSSLSAQDHEEGRIGVVHDRRFYAWRYCNPLSDYRFLFVGKRDVRGFLALQASAKAREADVQVVEWRGRSATDKALLLEAAMALGNFSSLSLWSSAFSEEEGTTLRRLGFVDVDGRDTDARDRRRRAVLARRGGAWGSARGRIPAFSRWALQGIDTDAF